MARAGDTSNKRPKGGVFARKVNGLDLTTAWESMYKKFTAYEGLVKAVGDRESRHLIVRGDPGLGKSYECNKVLAPIEKERRIRFNRATGHMTPLALYNNLFEYRGPQDITMFDDCDSVFNQPHAMNLLKAATDTRDVREILWGSTSSLVVVDRYVFDGSIIILTNVDMRASEKFNAFLDRVIYFDLDLTPEEKTARILWVLHKEHTRDPNLDTVSDWMIKNYRRFGKQLSIRSGTKLMELVKISPNGWQDMAEATILPKKPYQDGK